MTLSDRPAVANPAVAGPAIESPAVESPAIESPAGPRVFRIGPDAGGSTLSLDEDFLGPDIDPTRIADEGGVARTRRSRLSWGGLFQAALGMLASLWFGVYGWHFIETLFLTNEILGWIGSTVAAVAILALIVLLAREWRALARLDDLTELRAGIAAASLADDREAARALVRRLNQLYANDPRSAASRAEMEMYIEAIIDGPDLLLLAERVLLRSRDDAVRAAIVTAAKRVSLITTISPRAVVDVLFAGAQAIRLTRRIAELYGGRPGVFSFLRLGRKVFTHLAITGGMAVTDGVLSQVLGHGIAARLSAKLGEGVLNGILTARVGLAAIAVCRPMPFLGEREPKLAELAGTLMRTDKNGEPGDRS